MEFLLLSACSLSMAPSLIQSVDFFCFYGSKSFLKSFWSLETQKPVRFYMEYCSLKFIIFSFIHSHLLWKFYYAYALLSGSSSTIVKSWYKRVISPGKLRLAIVLLESILFKRRAVIPISELKLTEFASFETRWTLLIFLQ